MTKPFALLLSRPQSAIVDDETAAYLRYGQLQPDQLVRHKLSEIVDRGLDLSEYSGIIVSGSAFDYSAPEQSKSDEQRATERALSAVLDDVVAYDMPFLGVCFGLHGLAVKLGVPLVHEHAEDMSIPEFFVTPDGAADPVFGVLPQRFHAVTGHHDSLAYVPEGAALLVGSAIGPVHAIRVKNNVYGIQFHPEINRDSLEVRISYYTGGYYERPDDVRMDAEGKDLDAGGALITRFVQRYSS